MPTSPESLDLDFTSAMELALTEARLAKDQGEVPVGAVVLSAEGHVLAKNHNQSIGQNDPSAHAEILALRQAGQKVGNYRLPGSILVVTLEPCLMCVGALTQARVAGVVFGARDPKAGAILSCLDGPNLPFLNHRFWVREGLLADQAGQLLKDFFSARRGK